MGWAASRGRLPVVHLKECGQHCTRLRKWACKVAAAGGRTKEGEGGTVTAPGTVGQVLDPVSRGSI